MAGDRHGKHNTTTISFRVNSYEKATIEERVKVSGMKKQDYIVRSCIYNHVCVVGKKETIEIIRSEMKEMSLVLEDVAKDLKSEKPVISEPVLDSMTERYLAFLEAALWITWNADDQCTCQCRCSYYTCPGGLSSCKGSRTADTDDRKGAKTA